MKYYDYQRGLQAPYTISVLRTAKKVYWVFARPMSLSFFGVLFGSFISLFFLTRDLFAGNSSLVGVKIAGIGALSLLLSYWYMDTKIDGLTPWFFVKDLARFVKDFIMDTRPILSFERVREVEKFQFEKWEVRVNE